MTKIKQKIPKLRFPEFSGEWEEKKLGEVVSNFSYGIGASAVKYDGINKYLRITDIDDNSRAFVPKPLSSPNLEVEEKYILKENDIVFARTGASVGKSYLYNINDGKLIFAGFLIKAHIDKANSLFTYYQTLRYNYDKWVQVMSVRSGQPGINAEEYKTFSFYLPSLPEQEKIANFLSSVDKKIELLEEEKKNTKEYKKGVMQKIFSQELRFKDENGDEFGEWEEKKIGEIIKKEKKTGRLSSEGKDEGIYTFFNNSTKASDKYINEFDYDGEMIIANTGGEAYFDYYNGKFGAMSDCFVFTTNEKVKFLYFFLKKEEKRINKIGFTGSGIKHLNKEYFGKIQIFLPSIEEQEKISDFLSKIDEKIDLMDSELEKNKEFKKGVLQDMFV